MLKAASDLNENVQQAALKAFWDKLGENLAAHTEVLSVVLKAAGNQEQNVRRVAIEALGKLGEKLAAYPEILFVVVKATGDREWNVRREAVDALGKLGEKLAEHREALSAVLKAVRDQEWNVRQAAIEALGKLGEKLAAHPEALSAVLEAMGDQKLYVRLAAIEALVKLGETLASHTKALSAVLKAMGDQEPNIRRAAIDALGKLGEKLAAHPEAFSIMLKAAGDGSAVGKEATYVLQTLDVTLLVQGYLKQVGQQQGLFKRQSVCLSILIKRIEETWPVLAFDGQTLIVVSGSRSEHFVLSSPEPARPLLDAIEGLWKSYGFPPVTFKACLGKTAHYSNVRPPEFKDTAKLSPLRHPKALADSKNHFASEQLDSTGKITLNFTVDYSDLTFIDPPLGRGSLGAVYRGTHDLETVAIKRFKLEDISLAKQILAEASILTRIHSNHLVHLRGVCLNAPHYCVLMEYLPNGDLYSLLGSKKGQLLSELQPLTLSQRYRLATDIAIGLCRLHEYNILHRNLKSPNVLLYELEGELRGKLSDFGLSILKPSLVPNPSEKVISLSWLAPEIVKGTGEYSKASDVYSLGMVLYELTTGKMPYVGLPGKLETPKFEKIKQWIKEDVRPWQYLPKDCPAELAQLICDCCAEDPNARPAAKIVAQRLQSLYNTTHKTPVYDDVLSVGAENSLFGLTPQKEKESKGTPKPRDKKDSKLSSLPPNLMEQGTAAVDEIDQDGRSSLFHAVAQRNTDQVKNLLAHGARINLADKKGKTPLDVALELGESGEELVALLLQMHKPQTASSFLPKTTTLVQNPDKKEDKTKLPLPSTSSIAYSPRLFSPAPISSLQASQLLDFQEELGKLCQDRYTFRINRPGADQLVIQFTALNSLLKKTGEIRDELVDLTRLLQKLISDCGMTVKPHQFQPDWGKWALTIQAEPALLDQIANLLHKASLAYLSPDAKTGKGFFEPQGTDSHSPSPSTGDSGDTSEPTCIMQ